MFDLVLVVLLHVFALAVLLCCNTLLRSTHFGSIRSQVKLQFFGFVLFSCKFFCKIRIVPLLFVFDKYYPIMY